MKSRLGTGKSLTLFYSVLLHFKLVKKNRKACVLQFCVRTKQVLVIDLLIFQLFGHSKHISFQHVKIYAQFVYSIFRGSLGAAKFHTRVLAV